MQQVLQFVKKKVRRTEFSKVLQESSNRRKMLNFRDQLKEYIKTFRVCLAALNHDLIDQRRSQGSTNSSIRQVLQEVIDQTVPSESWSGVRRRGEVYDRLRNPLH